jgi:hypothetical protein
VLEVVNGGNPVSGANAVSAKSAAAPQALDASSDAPALNLLPLVAVEQVLGGLEHASQVVQNSAFIQPGVILTFQINELFPNTVHDLALIQRPGGADQAEWLPEDWLTSLGQTARQAVADATLADTQDILTGGMDEMDLDGLEAYFSREAREGAY